MGNIIAFGVGALIGVILTIALLSPENLRKYQRVSNNVESNYAAAKAVYKSEIYGDNESKKEESEDDET